MKACIYILCNVAFFTWHTSPKETGLFIELVHYFSLVLVHDGSARIASFIAYANHWAFLQIHHVLY